jgi:diguanylate cyclase (GGDEF)-like protein/PAS domain S-box-containing protein
MSSFQGIEAPSMSFMLTRDSRTDPNAIDPADGADFSPDTGMLEPKRIPIHKRLSFKQARNTLLLTLVLGLFLSSAQIFADLLHLQSKTDSLVNQVLNTVRDAAAESAYAFDRGLAARVIGGLFEYRPILSAELRDDFGTVLAAAQRPRGERSPAPLADLILPAEREYTLPLVIARNGQTVGQLRVAVDRDAVAEEFFSRAGLLLGASALWTLGIGLILLVSLYISITQPVLRIAHALAEVDPAHPAAFPLPVASEHKEDELGLLARFVNQLLVQFGRSLERHRAAESRVREREARLRGVMENVADGIVTLDMHNRVDAMNRAALALFGYEAEDVRGLPFDRCLAGNDIRRFLIALARCLERSNEPAEAVRQEFTALRRDGTHVPIALSVSQARIDDQVTVICVVQDITARKRAEQALRESEQRLKLAVTATRSGVWDTDLRAGVFWWSPEFIAMLGYDPYQPEERPPNWESLIHPDDLPWVTALRDRYLRGEVPEYEPVYRMCRKDGSWVWIEAKGQCLRDSTGTAYRFTGTMSDVTERKQFEKQLMYMATHDPLTGLPNRTLLQDRLQHAMTIAQRKRRHLAALFVDLDRFKLVNDSLGHNVGDALLKAVADAIRAAVRPTDTVGRLGGDEFLVIAEDLNEPQDANGVAKAILAAFAKPVELDNQQLFISASVGIALYDGGGIDIAAILRHADAAMYSAKSSGGNTHRFFIPEMNEEMVARLEMERRLREAIDQGGFQVFYQPKIEVATLRPVGLEALLRWPQEDGSYIPPDRFIPAAEELGLIPAIGEWVMRQALKQVATWKAGGIDPLPIAVNVSVRQLTNADSVAAIRAVIEESPDEAPWLEIEVTESKMMDNLSVIVDSLRGLRDLGLKIAVDDFGTGHSSLSYLRRLPITALKVDRSFINDISSNADDAAIAATIIAMGHQLGLTIVAEGIETAEQLDFLRRHNCDEAQGFHFARPMPVAELEARFRSADGWVLPQA